MVIINVDRAELAYEQISEQVQFWYSEDPTIEVHVSTIGVSRGTGSQRHLANLLDDRGILNSSGDAYLIEPEWVHQDLIFAFDSVVKGQENILNLGIPDTVKNTVHLTAADENRINFDLASVIDPANPDDPGLLETPVPGAHMDVGGIYDYDGLSARSLALGYLALGNSGVPLEEIPDDYQPNPDNTTIHDSGDLFNPANWEWGEREVEVYENPERTLDDSDGLSSNDDEATDGLTEDEHSELVDSNPTDFGSVHIDVPDSVIAQAYGSALSLGLAIQNEDALAGAESLANLLLAADQSVDFLSEGAAGNLAKFAAVAGLAQSIQDGNELGIALDGLNTLQQFGAIGDITIDTDTFGNVNVVGGTVAAYGLYQAIDSGDIGGAISNGTQLYSAITGNALPGAQYADAVLKALDGDIEAAGKSAVSAAVMQAAIESRNPYAIAAAVVFSIVVGGAFAGDKIGSARAVSDGEGGFDIVTGGNKDAFEDQAESVLSGIAESFTEATENLPAGLVLIPERLPQIRVENGEIQIVYIDGNTGKMYVDKDVDQDAIGERLGEIIASYEHFYGADWFYGPEWEAETTRLKGHTNEARQSLDKDGHTEGGAMPYFLPELPVEQINWDDGTFMVTIADLDGDGAEIVDSNTAHFDIDGDGYREPFETWVGPDDAIVGFNHSGAGAFASYQDFFNGNWGYLDTGLAASQANALQGLNADGTEQDPNNYEYFWNQDEEWSGGPDGYYVPEADYFGKEAAFDYSDIEWRQAA